MAVRNLVRDPDGLAAVLFSQTLLDVLLVLGWYRQTWPAIQVKFMVFLHPERAET